MVTLPATHLLVVVESVEPANLHRGFWRGLVAAVPPSVTVVPVVLPRDVQFVPERFNRYFQELVRTVSPIAALTINGKMLTDETLTMFREAGVVSVLWSIDDPYEAAQSRVRAAGYDLAYSTDFTMPAPFQWLPFGWDPETDHLGGVAPPAGVVFIGSVFPAREPYLRALRTAFGAECYLAGSGAEYFTEGRVTHQYALARARVARVVVNFTDQPNGVLGAKNRLPELLGARCRVVTQCYPTLTREWGGVLPIFQTVPEMVATVRRVQQDTSDAAWADAWHWARTRYAYPTLCASIFSEIQRVRVERGLPCTLLL